MQALGVKTDGFTFDSRMSLSHPPSPPPCLTVGADMLCLGFVKHVQTIYFKSWILFTNQSFLCLKTLEYKGGRLFMTKSDHFLYRRIVPIEFCDPSVFVR